MSLQEGDKVVVVHIVESFGGGVFASVTQTCNKLVSLGIEVHLVYSERDETPQPLSAFVDSRIRLRCVSMTRNINPIKDMTAFLALLRFFRGTRVDVIHLHSSKAGVLGRAAAYVCGLKDKVFYSPRGLSFLQMDVSPTKRSVYRWLEWLACRMGGTVIACSKGEYDEAIKSLNPKNVVLVENAVDVGVVLPKQHNNSQVIQVGTVGRIGVQKDPQAFMDLVSERRPECEFVWVGGGDQVDAEKLESLSVRVTGWLVRKEALEQLSLFDIYVQTSLWEGMPIAVIESMVAGIPAVVTNVVGNRDVIDHGETGFVASNAEEFKVYLDRLIKDPSLRKKMGDEARKRAISRFSLDRMIDELISVYGIK